MDIAEYEFAKLAKRYMNRSEWLEEETGYHTGMTLVKVGYTKDGLNWKMVVVAEKADKKYVCFMEARRIYWCDYFYLLFIQGDNSLGIKWYDSRY